ncbi:MAG: c-type cytochrome domain-containing protein [Gemmatales bacterium]
MLQADDKKLNFQEHVLPLLREKCASCHNPDKKQGGVNVLSFSALMEGGSRGKILEPGDPEQSTIYLLMAHKEQPAMPPKSPKLPDKDLELVANWIKGGALDTAGSTAAPKKPKADLSLKTASRGKPEGPPPMPADSLLLDPLVKTPRGNAITALAASPWAPVVAVASSKSIILYHTDTQDVLGVLPFPEGQINVLKFSRNGALLLAAGGRGGQSGKAIVYDIKTGNRVIEVGEETDAILAADISPDQSQIAVGNASKMVRIYSTKDGSVLHKLKKHTDWVTALEFSPDGVLLATGDRNGGLAVWEAGSGQEFIQIRGPQLAISEVSWRPDGNILAVSSEDTQIRLFEMENGNQVKAWGAHGGGALSVKYHHDGRLVSTGRDRVTKIWDGNGALQKQTPGTPDVALKAAWAHDGSKVLAGDWVGQVHYYSAADGKEIGQVVSNPLGLDQRLAAALQQLTPARARQKQTNDTFVAVQAALQKANTELAAVQKQVADTTGAVKHWQNQVNAAAVDPTLAAAKAAGDAVPAKEQAVAKLSEVAAKAKEAAEKLAGNAELATFSMQSQALAAKHATELAAAKQYAAQMLAAAKPAQDRLAAAHAELGKAQVAHNAASQLLPGKQAAQKAAQDQLPAAQSAAQAANAEVQVLETKVARMQKATATKTASK